MEVRNPFGVRDGKIIMIEDVSKAENGLRCKCVCPSCNEPFEARMGDVRRHHFAHSGQGCDEINAYVMGLYMLMKEYIETGYNLYLPPVIVRFPLSAYSYLNDSNIRNSVELIPYSLGEGNEETAYPEKWLSSKLIQNIEIVKSKKGQPQALLIYANNRTLAVRVRPPDTVCKLGVSTRYKEYSTLEINLSSLEKEIQSRNKEELFHYLMSNTEIFGWVYNPKMDKAFPQIMKRTKAYYEAAQAKIKKQEEEQKKREEQARREAERRAKAAEERRKREETARIEHEEKQRLRLKEIQENPHLFIQQETQVRDLNGNRWVKCEKCGAIKIDRQFVEYGGYGRLNIGTCADCSKDKRC